MRAFKSPWFVGVTFVVLALVIGAVVVFGQRFLAFQKNAEQFPAEGSVVSFIQAGTTEQYAFTGDSLALLKYPEREDGVVIKESVPSTAVKGDEVVLTTLPGERGMLAGVLHPDGNITALMTGGTNKADLVVLQNDTAVFSVTSAPLSDENMKTGADDEAPLPGSEETGTASGPAEGANNVVAHAAFPVLYAVDIRTRAIRSLGPGYSPRELPNGMVLAAAPEGIVAIDAATGQRKVVIAQQNTGITLERISPSARTVAVVSPTYDSVQFYRIGDDAESAVNFGYLTLNGSPVRVGLADDLHFYLRTASNAATYYNLPTAELPVAVRIADMAMTQ